MSRFVRPELTTLTISNGDTLTVRRRLTHGERSASYERMFRAGIDGKLVYNNPLAKMAMITAYLIDWSVTNDDGAVEPIRDMSPDDMASVLNSLDPESFDEISEAIGQHSDAMDAERAAKKQSSGSTPLPATSTSPVDSTGAMSGSET